MEYIKNILGRNIESLDIEFIKEYFKGPREESDTIEYKSYFVRNQNNHNHKERAILKTICGMLNSQGGIIVWGAPIETRDPNTELKYYSGELSLINKIIHKDHLLSRIYGSITPLPCRIKLEIFRQEDYCCCVIEIQQSDYPPHQFENVYYIRLDGQTHPAPHHYVESMMKQIKYPNVECYLKVTEVKKETWINYLKFTYGKEYLWLGIRHFIFNWSGYINEEDVSYSVITDKGIFLDSIYPSDNSIFLQDGRFYKPLKNIPILFFGENITKSYYIIIDPEELQENSSVMIIMSIGGKKSPQKRSIYSINFSLSDPNQLLYDFIITEENKLVIDSHLEQDITKENILKKLLNR